MRVASQGPIELGEESLATGVAMTRPVAPLTRMFLFLVIVGAVVAALLRPLLIAFRANVAINGVIVAVFAVGVLFTFRQVLALFREIRWVNAFGGAEPRSTHARSQPRLLAPMAVMLAGRPGAVRLSAATTRALLDSVGSRLDEGRDISRYLISLSVFLGLLGTFWGLMQVVGGIAETLRTLNLAATDPLGMFSGLRAGLERPLTGMGTAFSSSLLGLSSSLVLGFLDLQAAQAQSRFYNELEERLSAATHLGAGGGTGELEAPAPAPAYVTALLERTAETLDALQRTLGQGEERRAAADGAIARLATHLERSTDQPQLEAHLRSIDRTLRQIAEESTSGRNQAIAELRGEIRLLARTIAIAESERKT